MTDDVKDRLAPKEAIDRGLALFKEFYAEQRANAVLLEGLELNEDDGIWHVSFSFDGGQKKKSGSPFNWANETVEPIREIRTFEIDAKTGRFLRMTGH